MTTAELIARLRAYPPDTEVLVDTNDGEDQPIEAVFLYAPGVAVGFVCIDCTRDTKA